MESRGRKEGDLVCALLTVGPVFLLRSSSTVVVVVVVVVFPGHSLATMHIAPLVTVAAGLLAGASAQKVKVSTFCPHPPPLGQHPHHPHTGLLAGNLLTRDVL